MYELELPFFMINLEYFKEYLSGDDFAIIAKFLQDEVTFYDNHGKKQFHIVTGKDYNKVFKELMNHSEVCTSEEESQKISALISKLSELDMENSKPIVDDIRTLIEENWSFLQDDVKSCLCETIFTIHRQLIYPYAECAYVEFSYAEFAKEFEVKEEYRWNQPDKFALSKSLLVDGGYEFTFNTIKGNTIIKTTKYTKKDINIFTKLVKYFDANWNKEFDLGKAPIDTVTSYLVRTRVDENGLYNIINLDNYISEYDLRKNNDPV